MRILLFIPLILTFLYLNTALVSALGGPGEKLVVKPFHGVYPFYGGGEENSWVRVNPGKELPWWHHPNREHGPTLIASSAETTIAPWTVVYGFGYLAWLISLVFAFGYGVYWIAKMKNQFQELS